MVRPAQPQRAPSIVLRPPTRYRHKQDVFIPHLTKLPGCLLVWWYGKIYLNTKAGNVPHVSVCFRPLMDDQLGTPMFLPLPITFLGQLRIGTVWREGRLVEERVLNIKQFTVNLNQARIVTPSKLLASAEMAKDNATAISRPWLDVNYTAVDLDCFEHPVSGTNEQTWLLAFSLKTGGVLYIPCLEFFARCYARSQEVRRCLTTYSFDETKQRLFEVPTESGDSEQWSISIKPPAVREDAVFLAHVHHDPVTQIAAKFIYAQLEASHNGVPKAKRPAVALQIIPWFKGEATFRVEGFPCNTGSDQNEQDFLALRITGCSEPEGPDLELQSSLPPSLPPLPPLPEADAAENPPFIPPPTQLPPSLSLLDDQQPDYDAGLTTVTDPPFTVLGKRRVVHHNGGQGGTSSRTSGKSRIPNSNVSTDPGSNEGQGTGRGRVYSRDIPPSQGVMLDVWQALQAIARRCDLPPPVSITPDGQVEMKADPEPKLWTLLPTQTHQHADLLTYQPTSWDYVPSLWGTEEKRPRGVLIMRLKRDDAELYVVELERRVRLVLPTPEVYADETTAPPDVFYTEEASKGLMFLFEHSAGSEVKRWLTEARELIRNHKGVMQPVANACPALATTFAHTKNSREVAPYATTLVNRMIELGFLLPEERSVAFRSSSTGDPPSSITD